MSADLISLKEQHPELMPKTVGIILDGNRRWAKARGLKEIEGHRAAIEGMRNLIYRAGALGVKSITFWIFSTENFTRSTDFVDNIFSLAREYLRTGKYFKEITDNGGKLGIFGDLTLFPKDIANDVFKFISESNPKESKINVNFAIGYGGRDEILRAIKKYMSSGQDSSKLTEKTFKDFLDMKEDLDLVIRTGGNVRTSGFFPWQMIYSEMYFTKTLCPDFGVEEFDKAILYFTTCARNFGK